MLCVIAVKVLEYHILSEFPFMKKNDSTSFRKITILLFK